MSVPDPRTLPAYLRAAGLEVSPAESVLAVRALAAWPGSLDPDEAMRRLRTVLARDPASWRLVPELVAAWRRGAEIVRAADEAWQPGLGGDDGGGAEAAAGALAAAPGGDEAGGEGDGLGSDAVQEGDEADASGQVQAARGARSGASARGRVRAIDASGLAAAARRYAQASRPPRSRRRVRARRGAVDPGATWHASRQTRGEPLRLVRQAPPRPPAHRVLLVDTSASMHEGERWLTELARALARPPARVEVRAFDQDLRPGRWPGRAGAPAQGGTRIGPSLVAYLRGPGRRLRRGSHVMILSDGWETGDIRVLERALAALVGRAGRVDWLSPLAGTRGFQPTCRGLVTALRYGIGVYDVHDAASFGRYVGRLEATGGVANHAKGVRRGG